MRCLMQRFRQDESGQDLIEYTLLLTFVTLASLSLFISVGSSLEGMWRAANQTFANAAVSSTSSAESPHIDRDFI